MRLNQCQLRRKYSKQIIVEQIGRNSHINFKKFRVNYDYLICFIRLKKIERNVQK